MTATVTWLVLAVVHRAPSVATICAWVPWRKFPLDGVDHPAVVYHEWIRRRLDRPDGPGLPPVSCDPRTSVVPVWSRLCASLVVLGGAQRFGAGLRSAAEKQRPMELGVSTTDEPARLVATEQVNAFRARAHRLDQRISGDAALAEVASLCGVQDSPPGSAVMALSARVEGVTSDLLDKALWHDKSLLRTWAMRGAPFIVPTADLPVFTTGVLPVDEEGRTNLISAVTKSLDDLSGGLDDYVAASAEVVRDVLAGRRLEINELGYQAAERIAATLPEDDRAVWEAEGPHAAGQPLGEAVVHFCIRILTLQKVLCFAPREGRKAPFVLLDEWLKQVPSTQAEDARRDLVTRYLHAYGPSTPAGLARWLGVTPSDAAAWWDLVEVLPVDVDGSRCWLLDGDLAALDENQDEPIEGVRLLPPSDPFLQLADRDLLVPDRGRQRELWRTLHSPGALLVDGEVVGTWRGRKRASRLDITLGPFKQLSNAVRGLVEEEAYTLAQARGAKKATVAIVER